VWTLKGHHHAIYRLPFDRRRPVPELELVALTGQLLVVLASSSPERLYVLSDNTLTCGNLGTYWLADTSSSLSRVVGSLWHCLRRCTNVMPTKRRSLLCAAIDKQSHGRHHTTHVSTSNYKTTDSTLLQILVLSQ
jgi:hypothetical protein